MTYLIAKTNMLYLNNGRGQFYDATYEINLAADSLAMTDFPAGSDQLLTRGQGLAMESAVGAPDD